MLSTSSVAAALAVLPARDDAPHVIRQFTSIFLVSRHGELWRVFDGDDADASERTMPSPRSNHPSRIFVALTHQPETRAHRFAAGEPRPIDPAALQQQLEESVAVRDD
jgi:hypothetical protein